MTIINSVIAGSGSTPTGTKSITSNGTYDITDYASADVQVPTTAPEYYVKLAKSSPPSAQLYIAYDSPVINMSGIKDVTDYALARAYYNNSLVGNEDWSSVINIFNYGCPECFKGSAITSIDLSSLESIGVDGAREMFYGCHSLQTNINLSSLAYVWETCLYSAFEDSAITGLDMSGLVSTNQLRAFSTMCASCSNLTSVDLSSLTTAGGEHIFDMAFVRCTALTSVDFSSLTTISGAFSFNSAFEGCTALTNIDLSSLTTISGNYACQTMFKGCTSLQTVDLSGLQNVTGSLPMNNMFAGCTSLQTVSLGDGLTKRNPPAILDGVPVQTCSYADKLEYISNNITGLCRGNMFATANMKKLEMIFGAVNFMFANNYNLTHLSFPVLTRWSQTSGANATFTNCTNVGFTDLYFPMLRDFRYTSVFFANTFPYQLTVHFRKDKQAQVMAMSGSNVRFGAAALVFDLIGTITVNGTDYIYEATQNETGYKAWHKGTATITTSDSKTYTFAPENMSRNTSPDVNGPIIYGWREGTTSNYVYTDTLKPQVGDFIYTVFSSPKSTTISITAVDDQWVYTVDNGEGGAEPDVGDTVYSDAQGTVLGTISAVA